MRVKITVLRQMHIKFMSTALLISTLDESTLELWMSLFGACKPKLAVRLAYG